MTHAVNLFIGFRTLKFNTLFLSCSDNPVITNLIVFHYFDFYEGVQHVLNDKSAKPLK